MRRRAALSVLLAVALSVGLSGCIQITVAKPSPSHSAQVQAPPKQQASTETPTPQPSTPPPPQESALVQTIKAKFPGYPVVVDASSIDYRPRNEFNREGAAKVVALVPGLYMAYNANVTDLDFYIDNAVVSGDCTMKQAYFPNAGGDCWDGVQPGGEEPH